MKLVHQPGAEQRVVQPAAALAKQPPHPPVGMQPAEGGPKVDFASRRDMYGVHLPRERGHAPGRSGGGRQQEQRGEAMPEHFRRRVQAGGA